MRVARALARRITEVMQAQFDADILRARFPGQPPLAYFEILANEETDVGEVVKDVQILKAAGYSVEPGWLKEKTGYPIAATQPGQPGQPGQLPNRASSLQNPASAAEPHDPTEAMLAASLDTLLSGMHADFQPVAERLQDLLMDAESEADLQAGLELLLEDLPKLAAQVGANNATVAAWQEILGTAAANEAAS
jgi:hypothetical protein